MQMDTANFPRGQSTYHIVDVEEDVTINTVVEMDGTPMLESKINDIITTIYDGEHILLPANSKALEIIKKHTNPAGMMNRHYVLHWGISSLRRLCGNFAPDDARNAGHFSGTWIHGCYDAR